MGGIFSEKHFLNQFDVMTNKKMKKDNLKYTCLIYFIKYTEQLLL